MHGRTRREPKPAPKGALELGIFTRFLLRRSVASAVGGITAIAIVASFATTAFWGVLLGEELPRWAYGISIAVPLFVAPVSIAPHLLLLRRFALERERVRQLTALLPVCAWCRKVRADDVWQEIESYLAERSNTQLTHSICPGCADRIGAGEEG